MRRLLRLYPPAWRARYEAEVADLLDDVPASPRGVLDLVHAAIREWARAASRPALARFQPVGGPPMLEHPLQRHPTTLAILALLLVGPTFVFIVASLLAYEIGVPGLAATIEPIVAAVTGPRWVDPFLLAAPFVASVMAVSPLLSIGFARGDGELRVTFGFRARALNVVVLALCIALGGLLAGYLLVEFMFEAPLG
jgi:hypothetical protein